MGCNNIPISNLSRFRIFFQASPSDGKTSDMCKDAPADYGIRIINARDTEMSDKMDAG